jgi:hypothetical protein
MVRTAYASFYQLFSVREHFPDPLFHKGYKLFFPRVKGAFLSALEIRRGLVQTVNVLAEVMAMDKSPALGVVDMGDIFPLEVLMQNNGEVSVIGMIGEGAGCNWFVEHGSSLG